MFTNRLAVLGSIVFTGLGVLSINPAVQAQIKQLESVRLEQIQAKSAIDQADGMERQAAAQHQMVKDTINAIRAPFLVLQEFAQQQHQLELQTQEQVFRHNQEALDAQTRRDNEKLITQGGAWGLGLALAVLGVAGAAFIFMAGWRKFISPPSPQAIPIDRRVIVRPLPKPLHRPTFQDNGAGQSHETENVLTRAA